MIRSDIPTGSLVASERVHGDTQLAPIRSNSKAGGIIRSKLQSK